MRRLPTSSRATFIAVSLLGVLIVAGITLSILYATQKSPQTNTPAMPPAPTTQKGYSASAPKAPNKDADGTITCQANPDKKGTIINTVVIDGNGSPVVRNIQC